MFECPHEMEFEYEEDLVPVKEINKRDIIGVDINGKRRYAVVEDMSHAKPGKHGPAKTTITAKFIDTDTRHVETYSGSTRLSICKPTKIQIKVVSIEDASITYLNDTTGGYDTADLTGMINPSDIKKMTQELDFSTSEAYDVSLRALPGSYKVNSIKPSST